MQARMNLKSYSRWMMDRGAASTGAPPHEVGLTRCWWTPPLAIASIAGARAGEKKTKKRRKVERVQEDEDEDEEGRAPCARKPPGRGMPSKSKSKKSRPRARCDPSEEEQSTLVVKQPPLRLNMCPRPG